MMKFRTWIILCTHRYVRPVKHEHIPFSSSRFLQVPNFHSVLRVSNSQFMSFGKLSGFKPQRTKLAWAIVACSG